MIFANFLLHITGGDNGTGPWYLEWSGFVGQLTLFTGVVVWYKHHLKCATCFRLAYHKVEGTHYKTCHKHATASHHAKIQADHEEKYPEQHKFLKEKK